MEFRPASPGTGFRDNKLMIFRENFIEVFEGWPRFRAWEKSAEHPQWKPIVPALSLNRMVADIKRHEKHLDPSKTLGHRAEAYRQFLEPIPPDMLALGMGFPDRQIDLLRFFHFAGDAAVELAADAPALAYMVSAWRAFARLRDSHPARRQRRLVTMRRREILAFLGFAGGEGSVRIIRKIPRQVVSIRSLSYLRKALADPEVRRQLSFLPRVSRGVVRIVSDPQLFPMAAPRLLGELALDRKELERPRAAYLMRDVLLALGVMAPRRIRPGMFSSLETVSGLHEELIVAEDTLSPAQEELLSLALPPPPFEIDHPCLILLRSPHEILKEAQEMRSCLFSSYVGLVAEGRYLAYSVVQPCERATLGLRKTRFGSWVIDQMLGPRNREVGKPTWDYVRGILGEASATAMPCGAQEAGPWLPGLEPPADAAPMADEDEDIGDIPF